MSTVVIRSKTLTCLTVGAFPFDSVAQLWRLGWAKPVANLNTKSMRAGSTRVFRLPATFMSQKSYIRIQPDWLGDAYDK